MVTRCSQTRTATTPTAPSIGPTLESRGTCSALPMQVAMGAVMLVRSLCCYNGDGDDDDVDDDGVDYDVDAVDDDDNDVDAGRLRRPPGFLW